MKFTIVVLEAALETIPREIWRHPSVYRYARRRGKPPYKLLLDAAQHHQAMKRLSGREYRGRPDIAHTVLLTLLESPLCSQDLCTEVLVATTAGKTIHIRPGTRLPRNYLRFTGLMEQLLAIGHIPPNTTEPLAWIDSTDAWQVVSGKKIPVFAAMPAARLSLEEATTAAIEAGGFALPASPRSQATPRLQEATKRGIIEVYAIKGLEESEPWTLMSRILCSLERRIGLL